MDESRTQNAWTVILVSAFLASTLLIVAPGNLYLSNVGDFTLRLRDFLAISVPLFAVSTVAFAALLLLVQLPLRRRMVSFLFAFSVLLWFQGNILVWQYGPLDGRQIIWDDHWRNGVIDAPIWLVVLALSLVRPAPFYKAAAIGSGMLIVLPIIALFATAPPRPERDSHSLRQYEIDASAKYAFSKNENVIVIVLDEFQSDVFQEIVEAEEEYSAIFEGFTYFRDALAGSNFTELAVPALLTGRIFDNTETRSSFLERAYLNDSIMAILKRQGYIVDIYPWVGWANEAIFFDERIASNLQKSEMGDGGGLYTEGKVKEVLYLIDLALFRSTPHFIKRHIYNGQRWFLVRLAAEFTPRWVKETVSTDARFEADTLVAELSSGLDVTRLEPVFKYYHLKGAHTPLTVNQDLEFTNQTFPYNRQNYTAQAKASLRSLGVLFEELKRQNIFDESLIVVSSDHGSGDSPEMHVGTSSSAAVVVEARRLSRGFRLDKARGLPMLLVKGFGSQGSLQTSHAPVSLIDVPATIFSELGLEVDSSGTSVYDAHNQVERVRRYGAFDFGFSKGDYVSSIVFYSVTGDSWLDESWSIEGVYPPPTEAVNRPRKDGLVDRSLPTSREP